MKVVLSEQIGQATIRVICFCIYLFPTKGKKITVKALLLFDKVWNTAAMQNYFSYPMKVQRSAGAVLPWPSFVWESELSTGSVSLRVRWRGSLCHCYNVWMPLAFPLSPPRITSTVLYLKGWQTNSRLQEFVDKTSCEPSLSGQTSCECCCTSSL